MQHRASFTYHDSMAVYADTLTPDSASRRPAVVMVHGGAHTGMCYLATADGSPGWAYRFVEAGHPVWLPDWPGCGRSGDVPYEELTGARVCAALAAVVERAAEESGGKAVLMTHSMSGALGWRIVELAHASIAAVAAVAPGPPGNIQPEAEVISEDAESILVESFGMQRRLLRDRPYVGGEEFVRHKLIGRSKRFAGELIGRYGTTLAGVPPRLIVERQNVAGTQLRIDDPSGFAGLPVCVVTGEFDTDHPREADGEVVEWLRQAGAKVDYLWLPDLGIAGNGHMVMMEDNADEVAAVILDWIGRL